MTVSTLDIATTQVVTVDDARPQPRDWFHRNRWLLVILVLTTGMALRLRNTAFIDEALYIDAGKDFLNYWFYDVPLNETGSLFSGVPVLYPVIAGALDNLGGLYLVRAFSLLCVLVTIGLTQKTVCALFRDARTGTLAATAFAFTGSVMFVSFFATLDALAITLIATAIWLGVTRMSYLSAPLIGLVLAAAVGVKYAVVLFVPVALFVIVMHAPGRRNLVRASIALLTCIGILGGAYLLWGQAVRDDIIFTTTGRKALSSVPRMDLVISLNLQLGLLLALALIGGSVLVWTTRSIRLGLLVTGLFWAAMALPLSQVYLGEAVSFEKHTAYAAFFLAPAAGWLLGWIWKQSMFTIVSTMLLVILLMIGAFRSGKIYTSWLNVQPALEAIERNPQPGLYISSVTAPLKYHTRNPYPQIHWQTTFALYSGGTEAIHRAVAEQRYQMVIIWDESTGNTQQNIGQNAFIRALDASKNYALQPDSGHLEDSWLIYTWQKRPLQERVGVELPVAVQAPAVSTPAASLVVPTPVTVTPKVPTVATKPSWRSRRFTAKQVVDVRRNGHRLQRTMMIKYGLSHEDLHEILGTPVVPFRNGSL